MTLLYIGVRLARKWRRTRQGGAARADTSGGNTQDLERNGHTHNGTGNARLILFRLDNKNLLIITLCPRN